MSGTVTSVDTAQKRTYIEVDEVFMGSKALQLAVGDTIMMRGDGVELGARVIAGVRMVDGPTPPFDIASLFVTDSHGRVSCRPDSAIWMEEHVALQALTLDSDACDQWLRDNGVPNYTDECMKQGEVCNVGPGGASSLVGVLSVVLVLLVVGVGRRGLRGL